MSSENTRIIVNVDNTQQVVTALKRALASGLETIGLLGERYAKKDCPVDTGRLRNSITHDVMGLSVYIGTNVEYAPYVELGTSRQKAQPYLVPAAKNHSSEYRAVIRESLSS